MTLFRSPLLREGETWEEYKARTAAPKSNDLTLIGVLISAMILLVLVSR